MREIGARGGKIGKGNRALRDHVELGDYLARSVSPAELWHVLKLTMEGPNASARVSAARVVIDSLAEWQRREEQRRKVESPWDGAVPHDVGAAEATATLAELEKVGVITRGDAAARVAELRAEVARLEAQLAEFVTA